MPGVEPRRKPAARRARRQGQAPAAGQAAPERGEAGKAARSARSASHPKEREPTRERPEARWRLARPAPGLPRRQPSGRPAGRQTLARVRPNRGRPEGGQPYGGQPAQASAPVRAPGGTAARRARADPPSPARAPAAVRASRPPGPPAAEGSLPCLGAAAPPAGRWTALRATGWAPTWQRASIRCVVAGCPPFRSSPVGPAGPFLSDPRGLRPGPQGSPRATRARGPTRSWGRLLDDKPPRLNSRLPRRTASPHDGEQSMRGTSRAPGRNRPR